LLAVWILHAGSNHSGFRITIPLLPLPNTAVVSHNSAYASGDKADGMWYSVSELDELALSYAITIHKSQGSEYPIVIIPFTMQSFVMLQRNLLYTGITRGKKVVVLIGSKKAIGYAVRNSDVSKRNTGLAKRLSQMSEVRHSSRP
jgi:hypothetical protein